MLSERLKEANPRKKGCQTCLWLLTLSEKDYDSFNELVVDQNSKQQLYEICTTDPDNPMPVSFSAFKNHLRNCKK